MSEGRTSSPRRSLLAIALVGTTVFGNLAAGCAAGEGHDYVPIERPIIEALSTTAIEVGAPLEIYGSSFPEPDEGWVDVHFVGEFIADDGSTWEADIVVPLRQNVPGILRWESFGAYRVPFADGRRIGRFTGLVSGVARYFDGSYTFPDDQGVLSTVLDVEPSIVVLDFRGMGDDWYADCAEPSTTLINGISYGVRVEAIGFAPQTIEWTLAPGWLVDTETTTGTTRFALEALAPEQAILVRPALVPPLTEGFSTSVTIKMTGYEGETHELYYPVTVRRPIETYWTTRMEIAEILPAEPVSGCIAGGGASVITTYSESRSETRTRASERTLSRGWTSTVAEEHGETYGSSLSTGTTDTVGRTVTATDATSQGGSVVDTDAFTRTLGRSAETNFSFSDGVSGSTGWTIGNSHTGMDVVNVTDGSGNSVTWTGKLEGGIPGVIQGGGSRAGETSASTQVLRGLASSDTESLDFTRMMGTTSSRSRGASEGTEESIAEARSRAQGATWERSQSYSEANSFSRSTSVEATRSFSESQTRSVALSETIGESETEIYSVSTTEATSLDTQSWVWAGQFGVWYRQTTRMVRFGTVVTYDLCGNSADVGQVSVDDWNWAPDLAVGPECPPPTNMPPAECRIPPCGAQVR
jgi:hypothetical protein